MSKPAMQRRHFELIARVIRDLPGQDIRALVAAEFAKALRTTNAQFQSRRFIEASDGVPFTSNEEGV